jgi:hypothetical protein
MALWAYFVRPRVLRVSSTTAQAYIASSRLLRWLRDHPFGMPGIAYVEIAGNGIDSAYASADAPAASGTWVAAPAPLAVGRSLSDLYALYMQLPRGRLNRTRDLRLVHQTILASGRARWLGERPQAASAQRQWYAVRRRTEAAFRCCPRPQRLRVERHRGSADDDDGGVRRSLQLTPERWWY